MLIRENQRLRSFGAPDTTRTCDPSLRRAVLYPSELRARGSLLYRLINRHAGPPGAAPCESSMPLPVARNCTQGIRIAVRDRFHLRAQLPFPGVVGRPPRCERQVHEGLLHRRNRLHITTFVQPSCRRADRFRGSPTCGGLPWPRWRWASPARPTTTRATTPRR